MKPLECMGHVTLNDYVEFVRFKTFKGKYFRLKVLGFIAIVMILAIVCFAFEKLIPAFLVIVAAIAYVSTFNSRAKKIYKANAKYAHLIQHTLFGKNGFIFELIARDEKSDQINVLFEDIDKIYVAPTAVYVFLKKTAVYILPKRNIKVTKEEMNNYLKKYIPSELLVICV